MSISSIHLTVDVWTSPNRYLLLGVCAHFVAHGQDQVSRLLIGLSPIASHAGEEQFNALAPILEDFGIAQKIGSVVCDNASLNDMLCCTISNYLREQGKAWDPLLHRVRCIGHIINLAVQAFLFHNFAQIDELDSFEDREAMARDGLAEATEDLRQIFRVIGPLGKLHNIVIFIRASSGRTQAFVQLVGRSIPLDNWTRWNSWTNIYDVVLKHESKIDEFCKIYWNDLKDDFLSPLDWQKIRMIQAF